MKRFVKAKVGLLCLAALVGRSSLAVNYLSPGEARLRGESFGRTLEQRARRVAFSDAGQEKQDALRDFRRGLEVVGLDLGLAPFPEPSLRATPIRREQRIAGNGQEQNLQAQRIEKELDAAQGTYTVELLLALQKSRPVTQSRRVYLSGLYSTLGSYAWELLAALSSREPCVDALRQTIQSRSE